MRTVQVEVGTPINLGYQYDNEATEVVFPSTITSTVTATFGSEGTFAIWVRRSGDAVGYPVASSAIDYEDGAVTWLVKEADLAMPGTAC